MLDILSARGKTWRLPPNYEPSPEMLEVVGQSPLLAKILLKRGINSPAVAKSFLFPEQYSATDPYALPDMDKAIARINQAINNNEQVTIYGDYDVDGVTATSLMLTALQKLSAKVGYYIPNRATEGYGINLKAVSILTSKQKTKLLISCDCGVANFAEINFAKSLGVDTIVLDHHALPELLPPAKAIVHPKLLAEDHPLFHLPGVGVAYKVAEALLAEQGLKEHSSDFLDYVTLGMIADLVPLIRENRYLVQIGLPKLINSARPGIQALLSQIQQSEGTDIVGFGLAPRINAVGRLADAQVAVELLTTNDKAIAYQLSSQLQNENTKRQEICEQVLSEAEQSIASIQNFDQQKAIAIYKEGWHHGVVGIVASRLVDKYHKPVFIAELDKQEEIIKGSARGVPGLDLCEILKANSHLLNKWGGHKMAAGFSLSAQKADAFCAALQSTCNQLMSNMNSSPTLELDICLDNLDIDLFACAKSMNKLAPFGMENKKPLFSAAQLKCEKVSPLGRSGKHHRLDLKDKQNKQSLSCVFWNTRNVIPNQGDIIDIVFTPEINVFNGKERLQLVLSDWRLANNNLPKVALPAKAIQPPIATTKIPTISAPTLSFVPPSPHSPLSQASEPLAAVSSSQPELTVVSNKLNFIELRNFDNAKKIVSTAIAKLGDNLAIFSEQKETGSIKTFDRISLPKKPHLLIQQFPPSVQVWKQLITVSGASKIYVLGSDTTDSITAATFVKQLLGLVRYVVNKKDGSVEAVRITSALAATDVASALGLALLRKLELIDWYADEGIVYLDLLGNPPEQEIKQLTEYHQLEQVLQQINQFRLWCTNASLNEIESIISNDISQSSDQIESTPATNNPMTTTLEEYAFNQR